MCQKLLLYENNGVKMADERLGNPPQVTSKPGAYSGQDKHERPTGEPK